MISLLISCLIFQYFQILHIAALLELGTVLIIVGMVNFSLALLLCVFIVPFAILVNPSPGSFKR